LTGFWLANDETLANPLPVDSAFSAILVQSSSGSSQSTRIYRLSNKERKKEYNNMIT
jgi:hypothetical protein